MAALSRLAAMLEEAGAAVRHDTVPSGHNLSQADVDHARAWIDDR